MSVVSESNVQALDTQQRAAPRNEGIPYDSDLFGSIRVNRSAVERRAASLTARRSIKQAHQAAWLLKAISCIDLTTLAGDDTAGRVRRLCQKARRPVRDDILASLGVEDLAITTAAVCVYHNFIDVAVEELAGSGIAVAAVSTGFPAGQIPHSLKLAQIGESVRAGATEIDIVISRGRVLTGDWRGLYAEVQDFRRACGDAHLKTILATGELATLTQVAKASWVCMMAGADFIKTSTGKESVNATLPYGLVMTRAIRAYEKLTGHRVGFKPAGGISSARDALNYLVLMKEELGRPWLEPGLFRFGASSLLADIERQLEHYVTGAYSARHRHPSG
jgi:deoxyribose-phosphate aldolase